MKPFLDAYTFGATIKTIGMADVGKLVTPVPPIREQMSIIVFLAEEMAKLDKLAAEAERAISLLKERRSALLDAAVTGKIDIRVLAEPPVRQAAAA
jgi:type I restriction enzyme, S subunit